MDEVRVVSKPGNHGKIELFIFEHTKQVIYYTNGLKCIEHLHVMFSQCEQWCCFSSRWNLREKNNNKINKVKY